ncbi:ABC transporter ATP-binding protein [Georgenia wangjunii]|uniref:ABC transporter ATP-binding protein n=1 Tax=Georgenia wangjunii TaxID=3117730 RepID=UPI002F26AC26
MSNAPALEVDALRKRYGRREVVRGLSLHATRGAVTAVLGPNGAGKTTTVECCEGLRSPDAGHIRVLGLDRADPAAAGALRHRVGVMLQDGGLPLAPRAGDVLRHVARLHDDPADPAELLARLGLEGVARTSVRRLSGGQRQRLALACAIVGRPELVFLDEPSAGLDPQARLVVWELVRELRGAGTSIVLTTHLMDEAETLADHVVVVDSGAVIAEGTPTTLTGGAHVRVLPAAGRSPGGADPAAPAGTAADLARALAAAGRPDLSVRVADEAIEVGAGAAPVTLDARTVVVVASALAAIGHGDAGVELHRRTLEDAFLDLTGRSLR